MSVVVGFLYMLNYSVSIFLDMLIPRTFILLFYLCSYGNNNFWNNVVEAFVAFFNIKDVLSIDYENIIYVSEIDAEIFKTHCNSYL